MKNHYQTRIMNIARKFLSSILSVALLSSSMLPNVVQAKTTPSLFIWTSLIGDKEGQKSVLFDSVNDVVMSGNFVAVEMTGQVNN